jgi:hypothetical protein
MRLKRPLYILTSSGPIEVPAGSQVTGLDCDGDTVVLEVRLPVPEADRPYSDTGVVVQTTRYAGNSITPIPPAGGDSMSSVPVLAAIDAALAGAPS